MNPETAAKMTIMSFMWGRNAEKTVSSWSTKRPARSRGCVSGRGGPSLCCMVKKVFLLLSWKLLGKLWQIVSYDPTMREQFPGCELLFRRWCCATRRTATSGKIRENVGMRIKKKFTSYWYIYFIGWRISRFLFQPGPKRMTAHIKGFGRKRQTNPINVIVHP